MPATEPGASEGDTFGLPPLETVPGPSNPWAMCGGSGGEASNKPTVPVPDFGAPSMRIDWPMIGLGAILMAIGFAMVLVAIALVVLVILGAIAATGGLVVGIIGLGATGLVLIGGGAATAIIGIDPPTLDFRKPVALPRPRQVYLSPDAPADLRAFLADLTEVERLCSAEIDIVDRARAAARAKDDSWYETHIRALYATQGRKQQLLRRSGGSLKAFVAGNADLLQQAKIANPVPLRDAVNPITCIRAELDEIGFNFREVDALLATSRIPSPMLTFLEAQVAERVRKAKGNSSALLKSIAAELEKIETVDWNAFGGEPKKTAKAKGKR